VTDYLALARATLRVQLHDEDAANYRWTDATLNGHYERALREFGLQAPREQKTVLSTVVGTRDLAISSLTNLVRVLAVEYPTGSWPPTYVLFSVFGTVLTMLVDGAPGAIVNVNVFWGSLHTVDGSSTTLAPAQEDVVILGAAAYALLEWAEYAVNRVNLTGERTSDDYRREGLERLARFRAGVAVFGRSGEVLQSQLYTPADGTPSRFTASFEP
jgi:hypothetical protein